MSAIYKRGRAVMNANLTPMIDVIFLLIVFFVLVSRIIDVENVEMSLPQPEHAVTTPVGREHRVVINVLKASHGEIAGYRVGAREYAPTPESVQRMVDQLVALYRENPRINVNLRADRATHFEWVEPAMQAITLATARLTAEQGEGTVRPRVNLVVINED